jgi:hypothetical protein
MVDMNRWMFRPPVHPRWPDVSYLDEWLGWYPSRDDFDFFNPGLNGRKATLTEGNAGDVVLWSTRLPHGTATNWSLRRITPAARDRNRRWTDRQPDANSVYDTGVYLSLDRLRTRFSREPGKNRSGFLVAGRAAGTPN